MRVRALSTDSKNDKGFTLVELSVVMIIIGILAAIAISTFVIQRRKSVDASMKSDLRTMANEMESYYILHDVYPSGSQAAAGEAVTLSSGSRAAVAVGVSQRNVIAVAISGTGVTAGTFCLTATNSGGTGTWRYDSDQGGVLPKNSDCN